MGIPLRPLYMVDKVLISVHSVFLAFNGVLTFLVDAVSASPLPHAALSRRF